MTNIIPDVPSPIDLRNIKDAEQWANEVNIKRPWRYAFFEYYACLINDLSNVQVLRVLELGSGPGYLAEYLLEHCANIQYTAFDFSKAMHNLSIRKLLTKSCVGLEDIDSEDIEHYCFSDKEQESLKHIQVGNHQCTFIIGDFKQTNWTDAMANKFDVIIIHQALHELRHKQHASHFHAAIKQNLMHEQSIYLVCDHLCAEHAMQNNQLYMSQNEHLQCLNTAGFNSVKIALERQGLCLFTVKIEQRDNL